VKACLNRSQLEAFVTGELPEAERTSAEEHLATCPVCREAVGGRLRELSSSGAVGDGVPSSDRAATVTSAPDTSSPPPAEAVAGYEILHEIHRGGQGVVYKAVQLATKRVVALKVLLHGPYASAKQQHRFEREIDLVASLQHPNIITVYDSGIAQGQPYFAMEYIHGHTLDAYVSRTKLSIKETLRLFRKICSAVNAAHQHGIIHRDLKPGNIRVDADGEPHVLDFGLAKAAGTDVQDGVPVTVAGEFMGTLAYASPEQADGDPRLIDIRTDVYSLGVILFEMLTDQHPYPVDGSVAEVLRNIGEVEPKRPSALRRGIDDEVETIVLKALAKEKDRRYQSAEILARDVGHYLAGEPLDAKRDSTWYLLRKSLRRYRLAAGVAAAFVLTLTGATIGLSIMYGNQKQARQQAETTARELEIVTAFQQSMISEIDTEIMGRALYEDLRSRLRTALATDGVLSPEAEAAAARFEDLLQETNATDVALELLDRQVLDRAAVAIESKFSDQPVVRAALRQAVADTYRMIGRYPPALPLQKAALETRRRELGDEHPKTLSSLNALATLLETMGRYEEAEARYRTVLDGRRRVLGEEHPLTLASVNNLGLVVSRIGRTKEARALYEQALDGRRRTMGEDHRDTLSSIINMGALLEQMGEYEEALGYYREALAGNRRILGEDHLETLTATNNLGNLLKTLGRLDEALLHHSQAVQSRRRIQGSDHPETLTSIINLGSLLLSMEREEEALAHFREALAGWRRALGDDHPNTLVAVSYVGVVLQRMGRTEEAEPYYREALEGNRRTLGDDHIATVTALHNMGKLLRGLGRLEEAVSYSTATVRWAREQLPEGHPSSAAFLHSHAMSLSKLGRYDEAAGALREAHGIMEAAVGGEHRRTVTVIRTLVDLYEDWHAADPAGGHDTEAAEWRARLAAATDESASP